MSDARNVGLEVCTGDYISFVDSDDWIELNTYEIMMKSMNEYNADMVVSNINYVYKDKVESKYSEDKIRCFNKEEAMKELIKDGLVQGKLNEDEFFTYKICAKAERIVYIPEALYQYRQREDSIMGTYILQRIDGVEALYERMNFIKNKFPQLYTLEKLRFCYACIYHYQMLLINNILDKKTRNTLIKYRKSIRFCLNDVSKYSLKDNIYIYLSWISLEICCKLRNRLKIGY